VLRLTSKHGGSDGLDLRGAELGGADLSHLDLHGVDLWSANLQGANLDFANLQVAILIEADLREARLSTAKLQGGRLSDANLEGAHLDGADLRGADLGGANLQRAALAYANLRDSRLEDVKWGDYVVGEEIECFFGGAASAYRGLKQWHTDSGMYDIAGEFHYREMGARRKEAWQPDLPWGAPTRRLPYALSLGALRLLYGYGERPQRVIGWAAGIIFGLAAVHCVFGTVAGGILDALYFSAVSFTALGYGAWAPEPQGWAGKFLGVGEALMGVFMMALFLVTFTRKMTR
jgi:hypothetical protein